MKKKIISISLISTVSLCALAAVFAVGKNNKMNEIVGDDDYLSISFNGRDLLKGEYQTEATIVYKSQDVTLKTDQRENDVKFEYENCGCYEFNGTYYFQLRGTDGAFWNVDEIRSIQSLTVQAQGTFNIEWGFEKDGDDIVYERSAKLTGYNSSQNFDFEYSSPNYFKISIDGATQRQMTNFVIRMDAECTHHSSPYSSKNGLAFRKYEAYSYAKCIGFAGSPTATVNIPAEVDDLPVTIIGENAFYRQTGITSLTLPSGLETIEEAAFDGCSGITAVNIPKTVESIGFVAMRDMEACTSLTFESGGTSLLWVGQACFDSVGHEGVLTLPSRIEGFGPGAFQAANKITEFALNSDNVSGNRASVVDGVLFSTEWDGKYLIQYPCANTRTSYTIPADVQYVERDAGLAYANHIETLTIAPGDSGIYFKAYSATNMTSLTTINFGGTGTITFYWYCLRGASLLKDIYASSNLVIASAGLGQINSDTGNPLTVHVPGDDVPNTWDSNWDDGGVAANYIAVDTNYVA